MQKRFAEVDVLDETPRLALDAIPQLAQTQQHERHGQCHGHQTDRDRQFDVTVIEVAEAGRETDQNRDRVHQGHRDTAGWSAPPARLPTLTMRSTFSSMVNSKPGPRRCDERDSSCAGCLPDFLRDPPRVSTLRTTEPFTAPALVDRRPHGLRQENADDGERSTQPHACVPAYDLMVRTTSQVYR